MDNDVDMKDKKELVMCIKDVTMHSTGDVAFKKYSVYEFSKGGAIDERGVRHL